MREVIIQASDHEQWRSALAKFERVDVCHLPEYHEAYSLSFPGAQAVMWTYWEDNEHFCYPFLLSPVILTGKDNETVATDYFDVSGIYGYSGPLSTSCDRGFLDQAWAAFDAWAVDQNIVSEFIRFSTYVGNKDWAHEKTSVEYNRPVALAMLPSDAETFMQQLNSKTRNMIRKARKTGLVAKPMKVAEGLEEFRALYGETMARNQATDFFMYDDHYYDYLLKLHEDELQLFAVYQEDQMVAAAMTLVHGNMAFYHLGASTLEASRCGAGNQVLFEMACHLIDQDVPYFSVGGGRTTDEGDALFRFKKSNATSVGEFHIGKRVLQPMAQQDIIERWQAMNDLPVNPEHLQFYR